jgi:hypothetical protein
MSDGLRRRIDIAAEGRLGRPGGPTAAGRVDTVKEGVLGGTMGSPIRDQVEPRRLFIEQNAREVRFLDV